MLEVGGFFLSLPDCQKVFPPNLGLRFQKEMKRKVRQLLPPPTSFAGPAGERMPEELKRRPEVVPAENKRFLC